MTQRRSKLFIGVGVLCFVGVMSLWLASSGDRAIADAEKAPLITKTLTQSVDTPVAISGKAVSQVTFTESEGLVQRLSINLKIVGQDARSTKVYLTSPSGTKVLVVDGARSKALTAGGIEGFFGTGGLQSTESLAAFAGEPVTGVWKLAVESRTPATLKSWSLTSDVGPNTSMAGMETYGEYDGGDTGGCDCSVASNTEIVGGLMAGLMLLGLVAIRRRD